ncbi:MAG: hypothetical protein J6I64_08385 [Lachnospiraceae bacterium]|nr:hypothetical protein [Lachnospiraceae bacterium]
MKVDIEPGWESDVCSITYGMQGIRIDFATVTFDEEQGRDVDRGWSRTVTRGSLGR